MKRRKFLKLFAAAMVAPVVPIKLVAGSDEPRMGRIDGFRLYETENNWASFKNTHTYGNMILLTEMDSIPRKIFDLVEEDAKRCVPPVFWHRIKIEFKEYEPGSELYGAAGYVWWKYSPV